MGGNEAGGCRQIYLAMRVLLAAVQTCFDCRHFCCAMQYLYPSFDAFGLPRHLVSY